MVHETTVRQAPPSSALLDEWAPAMPPTDLIFDDGEPLESNRHRIAMNVLISSALQAFPERKDLFAGGNMFVYYSNKQVFNRDFRGPDFFVALEVDGSRERQGWVVWEEEGRYPNVIVELMSPSTAKIDLEVKKELYERTFRTADYFVYNPFEPGSLQGWHLDASQHYQPIPVSDLGWLWCESLQLWLGLWEGSVQQEPPTTKCQWLRLYDPQGNLIPLPEETAEQESQRAEQESQRAEQESQRAEQAEQLLLQERQRAERLAARLREMGENLDDF